MKALPSTLLAAAVLLSRAVASGQTLTPAQPARIEDSPILLSPFQVDTKRDTGFVAATSLAGGRLATDLADTPAAYSVLTREFIDALNITDLATAIEWTVNTNASNDNGAIQTSQVTNLFTLSRGVTAGTPQRNFFPFGVNFDSYNLDRYDFSRGPNSILFGNGALGGSANVVTKQARFDRATRELTASVGSWGMYRTTLDANQPVGSRAAVRANFVLQDGQGWRDRDFSKVKAMSLTGTLRLGRATEVRLEGEYGESSRTSGYTTIGDNFAGWNGVTTFTGPLAATPANANALGVARNATPGYYVYAPGSGFDGVMNYQNSAITLGAAANAQVPIVGKLYVGGTPNANGTDILNSIGLPANRFDNAIAGSKFRLPSREFTQSFDSPGFWQRFQDAALYVNHAIGSALFLEAAFDANDSHRYAEYTMTNGLINTLIDINRNLPNGAPNPNFLEPYSEAGREKQERHDTTYNARVAVAWLKDTRIGEFKFNTLAGINNRASYARFMQLNPLLDPDPRRWPLAAPIRYRYYWNDATRPMPPLKSVALVDPVLGLAREVRTAFVPIPTQAALNSTADQKYRYALAALNGRFLDKRLVLLGAVRFDGYSNTTAYNSAFGDYPTDWNGSTILYRPAAPADYATLTYVPKDAQGRPTGPAVAAATRPRDGNGQRLPQYAGDRFQDDFNFPTIKDQEITYSAGSVYHVRSWWSVYANYAQTFTIPPANTTVFNRLLPATVSEGLDAGLRFSLLEQRVRLSLNRYFSKQSDQPFTGPIAGTIFNGIISANAVGDFSDGGGNIRNVAQVPPAFIQDRRDVRANGYEFEIVANVAKSLRVSGNFAIARAYGTNAGNITADYVDQNLAILRQIVIDAGGSVDANQVATVNAAIPVNQRSPDVNTAVSSWNSMISLRRGIVSGPQIIQNTSSANLYADYTIGAGRLKGLRLGAGARYRGRIVIGNRASDTIANPANPLQAIDNPAVDAYTPVYAAGYTVATATVGYTWRFMKDYPVNFTLRIDNLLDEDHPHYNNTLPRPPGGDVTNAARISVGRSFWYNVPRSYNLTARLAF